MEINIVLLQVEISLRSREITTFITSKGLYRYKRLNFGINCALENFQRIMEMVLSGLNNVMNFLDDIAFHTTKEGHDVVVTKLLERLASYNITLNMDKCVYGMTSIIFLGHRLSAKGIEAAEDKLAAIKQFRTPNSAEEIRSFLGLANFLAKFISDLSTLSHPLRELTKHGVSFEWTQKHTNAFNELKNQLAKPTILGYYDVKDRTRVVADASPVGLGAVLLQFDSRGPRVISFASRALTDVEKRYAQTEKEALALIWAVERFKNFLYGKEFELVTDCKPLEIIFGPNSRPCARIERWVMRLMAFKYRIIFKPGKTNIADSLSRLPCSNDSRFAEQAGYRIC